MNYLHGRIYRIGEFEVDPAKGCLRRDGQEQYLRQMTFQVLLYLLNHHNRLVTKDELFGQVWRGATVTDDALVKCIVEIRKALGDDRRRPRFIKTISRRGYRFIGPVEDIHPDGAITQPAVAQSATIEVEEVMSVEVEVEEDEESGRVGEWESGRAGERETRRLAPSMDRRVVIGSTMAVVAIAIIAVFLVQKFFGPKHSLAEVTLPNAPGRKAVAVMYFDNQSGQRELDWLREGLADMLITNLSRSPQLSLLSRQQLHALLERIGHEPAEPIRFDEAMEIARRSRAAVIATGGFAQFGAKVRLDAQLHDVATGELLAAESLVADRPEQILTQVEMLSLKLATRLGGATPESGQRPNLAGSMTNNLEAYRCYSLALEKAPALDNTEAIALLEKAVALDPEFAMAHARIGYAYAVTWDFAEKAKPYLERAFQLSHRLTEKDKLYIAAWYAIADLDFAGAMKPLREVIALDPRDIEAHWRLGCLLEGEDQFQEAIDVLRQAVMIDPEAKDIFNTLAFLNADLGRHEEATAMINRHIALAPNEPNAHNSLGLILHWAGRYDEAIAAYEKSLALDPDFDLATVHLGNAYFHQGRYRKAIDQYQRYIQIAQSQMERARGYGRIAWVYWKKGDRALAEANARRELRLEPTAVFNSVTLALDRGDFARVEQAMRRTKQFSYTSRGARTSRRYPAFFNGWIAFKQGRADDAVASFKQTLKHRPPIWATDPYEDCLANAYLELGRLDEAIAEYERLLRLNPNYPLAQYHLGQAYERKGDGERAREAYRNFMQIWKDADADIPEVINAKAWLAKQ
jgi:tetratricopeptide (TPR) repeat protein/DNA-binding winged helix-turn-helix (wHTH) protein